MRFLLSYWMKHMLNHWHIYGSLAAVYAVGAAFFLAWVKLDVDEEGEPYLNPNRLHFRIAKPLLSPNEREGRTQLSICTYYIRFVIMSFLWPIFWSIVGFWAALKTLVYGPFMLSFGFYPIANLDSMEYAESPFAVEVGDLKWSDNIRIGVAITYVVVIYALFLYFFPRTVLLVSAVVAALALWLFIFETYDEVVGSKERETKPRKVNLTRHWLKAKKDKVCMPLKVKSA